MTFHNYTWDADANPLTIDSIGLTYDAFDRVVEQNQSGTYYQIVYTPMGTKLGLFKGQTIQQLYIPLPGGDQAEYLSWGLSHYRHADWLGSDRLEASPTHAILDSNAYAPYGEPYAQTGNGEISFSGQNKDTDWLQYDFLARQYDPKQGRWISPDPAGLAAVDPTNPQSWNRYAYVGNSPLNWVDPLGLDSFTFQTTSCKVSQSSFGGACVPYCPQGLGLVNGWLVCGPPANLSAIIAQAQAGADAPQGPQDSGSPAPNNGTTCPPSAFKITGIAPGQAPGTTAISQTPRAAIPNGGVAIKPGNFGVGGVNSTNRNVFLTMTFTVNWSGTTVPSGIPTKGPFFPVDNIGPASVRNSPGNAFDAYNYPTFKQAWASTRTAMVTTYIPANTAGVVCPK